ncbi:MAG: type II secretion system secretin GspD [Oligoflexia bacterium]|nr:type II secretion system secretin GspD [Oligoflexia bacterium]
MKAEKPNLAEIPCSESELRWLQITAGLVSLIGMAGLLAIMSEGAWAQEPKPGFSPGRRTFTNPWANQPAPGGAPGSPIFDDEEEDEELENFGDSAPPPTFGGGAAGGGPGGTPSRPAGTTGNTLSGGGGSPGGVISRNPQPATEVNTETGEGSKEIVTEFNFPDADIMDIAKTLGKLTGKNFIFDKDVKGRISIVSNSPITVGDAWKAFLTALDINQFALIPSGKYIRIARQRDARDKQLRTYTGDYSPDTDALITRVFPLKYINAEEVARTFRSFMPANSRIIPYDQTNTVIVTDTGSNIAKLSKMLEILDVEGYDLGIEVIAVKFASASELSKLIDTLLPGTAGAGGPPGTPRFGGGAARGFNARRTKEGGVINTIISDERTNTLIVNANSKGADQVRELVAKLDQKIPAQRGGGRVHVVYLQFADAEQIANTLNNLSSQQVGGGFKPISSPGGGTGVNPVAASLFEGQIKVASDKATNSLVITASPSDFITVQRVINRLDIPRDEVFVEVVIMEVALSRGFNYSSNAINPRNGVALTTNQDLLNFIQNPLAVGGAIIGYSTQSTKDVTINGTKQAIPNFQAMIKLIQSNSKANVLATPQIIALDNTEATFESAENIPVSQTTAVQGGILQQSFGKERVALSIKIKPQINKVTNFVKLDVTAKLGDITDRAPPEAQGKAVATLERTAQTSVVVGDSDTVVIGGLMRDKVSETTSKIPLLGDIPLLGWLFRSHTSATDKTNLLIFLTPHIVRQYEKVRALLDKKLKERDDFLEANTGGKDPLRGKRDDIIRSLPDLSEIMAKRESTVTIDEETPAAVPVEPGSPFTGGATKKTEKPVVPPAPEAGAPAEGSTPADAPTAPEAPPADLPVPPSSG